MKKISVILFSLLISISAIYAAPKNANKNANIRDNGDGSVNILNVDKDASVKFKQKVDGFDNVTVITGSKVKKNNPVTVYKITRAVYRASKWLAENEENREKAVDLLIDKQYISATKEMGVKLVNLLHYGFGTKELVATTNVIGQEYKDLGLLPADFDLSDAEEKFLVKYDLTKIK